MYFNIGMKTIYLEVFQQGFGFPPITTRKGKIAWYCLGPVYWILAFLVAAAVPNIGGIVSFVGGLDLCAGRYNTPRPAAASSVTSTRAVFHGDVYNPTFGVRRWPAINLQQIDDDGSIAAAAQHCSHIESCSNAR